MSSTSLGRPASTLRDDQVLGGQDWYHHASDIHPDRPRQEVVLQPRPSQDDVGGEARWLVDERENPRLPHEVR